MTALLESGGVCATSCRGGGPIRFLATHPADGPTGARGRVGRGSDRGRPWRQHRLRALQGGTKGLLRSRLTMLPLPREENRSRRHLRRWQAHMQAHWWAVRRHGNRATVWSATGTATGVRKTTTARRGSPVTERQKSRAGGQFGSQNGCCGEGERRGRLPTQRMCGVRYGGQTSSGRRFSRSHGPWCESDGANSGEGSRCLGEAA